MRRLISATWLMCALVGCGFLFSCSSPTSTTVTTFPVPASVSLSPSPNVSLEVGKFAALTAAAHNSTGASVTETFTFQSSNPSVVTVANNGIACAGVWDSLTTPVVCTPGSTGTAQVTAVANGVTSPPVTVYVHQHVTRVVIQPVPGQPATLSPTCLTRDANHSGPESMLFEAVAYAGTSGTNDITPSVGQFTWSSTTAAGQTSTSSSVSLSSPGPNAPLNQEVATAAMPGISSIFASVGGVTSQPLQFTTCLVQSIALAFAPGSSLALTTGSNTATVNATVTDSIGMDVTGIPLTWTSSYPHAVTATGTAASSVFGGVGTVTGSIAGQASVTVSCTPPLCNGGISPSMPIYPTSALPFQVTSSSAPPTPAVFVTTTGCAATTLSCTTRVIPLGESSTGHFTVGAPVNLPVTPNSFVTGKTSGTSYLGVDSTAAGFSNQGLMIFSGSSVSQAGPVFGRVLAISPDSKTVILSDTIDSPSRVNICVNCASLHTIVPIFLSNATAAAFSPDGLKAYIVSGSSCPGTASTGCLLVYSQLDAPQFIQLSAVPTDAAFIGNGSAGYIAESSQTTFLPTCGPSTSGSLGNVSLAAQYLRPLPDGMSLVALNPPVVQTMTANITGPQNVPQNASGCLAPRGVLNLTNTPGPSSNLGTGPFVPRQFFLSPDGSVAYILAQTTGGGSFPFIIAFNVQTGASSQISLSGGAVPLSAGISPGGDQLLVGADDGQVHVIETATGLDTQQVQLTFANNTSLCIGPGNPATQVAVASLNVSAAQQIGTSTVYTYSISNGTTPQVGQSLVLTGMTDTNNNGTFTITAVNPTSSSAGTITVVNPAGVTASGQAGSGTVPLTCNPDLVVVAP
ncbi:MAG TPA: hypothetical protein VN682_18950 [Terriglobales bacterium]|nr:hypothetical protein [Terriglobales bacterium]